MPDGCRDKKLETSEEATCCRSYTLKLETRSTGDMTPDANGVKESGTVRSVASPGPGDAKETKEVGATGARDLTEESLGTPKK